MTASPHAMGVRVVSIHRLTDAGNLRGFATVEIGPWTIRSCRIIQQPGQRPYLALPQERAGDGRYWPIITNNDTTTMDALKAAVLEKWAENYDADPIL